MGNTLVTNGELKTGSFYDNISYILEDTSDVMIYNTDKDGKKCFVDTEPAKVKGCREGRVMVGRKPIFSTGFNSNSLTEVKGNIKITQNNNLEVLNGFNELRFSGGIEIASNENLIEVNAFHNLLEVENTLEIGSEDKIEIIDGFFELHTIGEDFLIRQNPNLLKISSFH